MATCNVFLVSNRDKRKKDAMNANTVSRRLKNAGFNISSPDRMHRAYGLFVKGIPGMATITVDLGDAEQNVDVAECLLNVTHTWNGVRRISQDTALDDPQVQVIRVFFDV